MNYEEAVTKLSSLSEPKDWDLGNMRRLVELMHLELGRLKAIHVTGSNGKGSVTQTVSTILVHQGYSVGTYTSPHLVEWNERIQLNLKAISREDFGTLLERILPAISQIQGEGKVVSVFEAITLMAFVFFTEKKVDFAVVEVGLGGRLDATNVLLHPLASVITNVSLEHTERLGQTLEEIAREKADIIKNGCVAITAATQPALSEIQRKADSNKSQLKVITEKDVQEIDVDDEFTYFEYKNQDYATSLLGTYQAMNAVIAITVIETLREKGFIVTNEAMRDGLLQVKWPGRLQIISESPLVIFDGAHNPDGCRKLVDSVKKIWPQKPVFLVLGILADKDYARMVKTLMELRPQKIICTKAENPRALDAKTLASRFPLTAHVDVIEGVQEALHYAKSLAQKDELILLTGSLYTIGEALKPIEEKTRV